MVQRSVCSQLTVAKPVPDGVMGGGGIMKEHSNVVMFFTSRLIPDASPSLNPAPGHTHYVPKPNPPGLALLRSRGAVVFLKPSCWFFLSQTFQLSYFCIFWGGELYFY